MQEAVPEQRDGVHDERDDRRERQRLVEVAQVGPALDELSAEEQADADGEAREQQRGGAAARLVIQKRCSVTAAASMGGPQDWLVVTVDGLLLLDEPEFELDVLPELLPEELESSSDDVV